MKVGLDVSVAGINQAGTGLYATQLAGALSQLTTTDRFEFLSVRQRQQMSAPKTLHTRLATLYRDLVWMHLLLPLGARRAGVDLLHMPAGISPVQAPCPVVLTIHDTVAFGMSGTLPSWQRRYFRAFGPRSARRAARIITDSDHSKREIIAQFGVPADRIRVVHLAASPHFRQVPVEQVADARRRYGLERFILCVGTVEPRKNLERLLEAFAVLRRGGCSRQLVHAGPAGWMGTGVARAVQRLGLRDSVRFLGQVPLADLVALYNAADVFVYPSLQEGFGLPVLEAMACGCPVVTSNVSSLPEVAGDAAVLLDPLRSEAIAEAIRSVLADPALSSNLGRRGRVQASRFSWQRCAQETLNVYHEAVDDHA
jgi:glycosyltransferase involved in cell wall biosynthesis